MSPLLGVTLTIFAILTPDPGIKVTIVLKGEYLENDAFTDTFTIEC